MSKYLGFLVRQRLSDDSPQYFVFFARAKDLDQWIQIIRTSEAEKAVQRVLSTSRVRSIVRFFKSDPRNSIPNTLLISLNNSNHYTIEDVPNQNLDIPNFGKGEKTSNPSIKLAYLDITDDVYAILIDGQHRLKGASAFDEEIALLVVAIIEPSPEERAFQFIVINNKSQRVPADNVKAIVAEYYDETKLNERLTRSGIRAGIPSILLALNNSDESPFYHLLDWDENRDGHKIVDLTAVEYSWRSIERTLKQFLENDDKHYDFFIAMWRAVKDVYPTLWGKDSEDNKLMKKVSLSAINDYLVENALGVVRAGMIDLNDLDETFSFFKKSIKKTPEKFWTTPWKIVIQDNTNVRSFIIKDMTTIAANGLDGSKWYMNLNLPTNIVHSEGGSFD